MAWLGFRLGQMDAVVLGLEVVALLAAMRGRSALGGLAGTAGALLAPQVLWPLPLLLVAVGARDGRWRGAVAGALAALLALVAIPALTRPRLLPAWAGLMHRFAAGVGPAQPDLAGLPGLVRFAPAGWRLRPGLTDPLTLAIVGAGLALLIVVVWNGWADRAWHARPPRLRVAWGIMLPLGVWILVTPYSHGMDALVLAPLALLALGPDGAELARPPAWLVVAAILALPQIFILTPGPGTLVVPQSLTAVALLGLLALATARWRRDLPAGGAGKTVASV